MTVNTYAVIESGSVVNVALWDGDLTTWSPPDGATTVLLSGDIVASIGWTYNGTTFSAPA